MSKNILMFLVVAATLLSLCCVNTSASDIYVPDDHTTIQLAIDNALAYDTIIIRDGTYLEELDVHQSVTIRSENGTSSVIVRAPAGTEEIVNITNDDIVFSSITVDGLGNYTCFRMRSGYENYTVNDCNMSGTTYGILSAGSGGSITDNYCNNQVNEGIYMNPGGHSTIIRGNTIQTPNRRGIYITGSNNITCLDNIIIGDNSTTNMGIRGDASSDHITIYNNTISGIKIYAIYIATSQVCNISQNVITTSPTGIFTDDGVNDILAENNTISTSTVDCMRFDDPDNVTIRGNILTSAGGDGIQVYYGSATDITIEDNVITGNEISSIGIYVDGTAITMQNNTITGGNRGIHIADSTFVNVSNCIAENATYGIYLKTSTDCNISGNNVSLTNDAVYLENSDNCSIQDNHMYNNARGVYFAAGSNSNTMRNNTVEENSVYGVVVFFSDSEIIYNNYFNNTNNYLVTSGSATWNTTKILGTNIIGGPYIGGNFWSDYTGVDTDGDGIGNTDIPTGPNDYLPLVLYSSPTTPSDIYIVTQMRTAYVSWSPSTSSNTIQPLHYHWNTTNTTGILQYDVTTNTYSVAISNLYPGYYNFSLNATDNTTFSGTVRAEFFMTNTVDMTLQQPVRTNYSNYGIIGATGLFAIPFLMKNIRDFKKWKRGDDFV